MSNGTVYERLWKLQTQINRLVLEGGRDPQVLIDFYQNILETPVVKTVECKTWMTVKLGTLKNVEEIRQALKAGGNNISDWANDILGKPAFKVSETETEVDLVNVSVGELGFKHGACYTDICKRANELGLDLCPAEVGPQLRLQWKKQPGGTCVVVAMNAITASDDDLYVFCVICFDVGGQYLGAPHGRAACVWFAPDRFVFLRRKVA